MRFYNIIPFILNVFYIPYIFLSLWIKEFGKIGEINQLEESTMKLFPQSFKNPTIAHRKVYFDFIFGSKIKEKSIVNSNNFSLNI
jgi:hypothetical protein